MIKNFQYYASGHIDEENTWERPEFLSEEDFVEISEEELNILCKFNFNIVEIGSYCFQEKELEEYEEEEEDMKEEDCHGQEG